MNRFRAIIDKLLLQLACITMARPRSILLLVACLTALMSAGNAFLYTDVSNESLFRDNDKSLQDYRAFLKQFGRDDAVIAAIDAPNGYTPDFLSRLRKFENALDDSVVHLDVVTSIKSVTSVSNINDDLLITDLEDLWPESEIDVNDFEERLRTDSLISGRVVSKDLSTLLVIVQASPYSSFEKNAVLSTQQRIASLHDRFRAWLNRPYEKADADGAGSKNSTDVSEFDRFGADALLSEADTNTDVVERPLSTAELVVFVNSVKDVVKVHNKKDFRISMAGGQLIDHEHKESIHADMGRLIPVVCLIVFLVIFLIVRNPFLVSLPFLVVVASSASTMGLMGWVGVPITPVSVALPPLLLTVGVCDSMHLISVFRKAYAENESRGHAILHAVRRSGTAILFTTLTTAAGFLAFLAADIRSVSAFGAYAAIGVCIAFFLTLTVIPACIVLKKNLPANAQYGFVYRGSLGLMHRMASVGQRYPLSTICTVVILCLLALPGVMKTTFSHDVLTWFAPDSDVRVNTYALDEKFVGLAPLEFVIDTGQTNGIYEPDFIRRLDEFHRFTRTIDTDAVLSGPTTSVLDTLLAIHAALNEGEFDRLPAERDLIAQQLLLFESSGADEVRQLIDSEFSIARVTARLSWADALDYIPIRASLEEGASDIFGDTAVVQVTGTLDLVRRALTGVIQSMATSYVLALFSVFVLMMILLGRFKGALLSMLPNVIPIFLVLGIMGYFGIPVTLFTVLLGGTALGLVVDDTVHLVHSLSSGLNDSSESVLERTIAEIGPALLFTTTAVATGFLVFLVSTNIALTQFGMMLSLTVVIALLVDIVLIPALFRRSASTTESLQSTEDTAVVTREALPKTIRTSGSST